MTRANVRLNFYLFTDRLQHLRWPSCRSECTAHGLIAQQAESGRSLSHRARVSQPILVNGTIKQTASTDFDHFALTRRRERTANTSVVGSIPLCGETPASRLFRNSRVYDQSKVFKLQADSLPLL